MNFVDKKIIIIRKQITDLSLNLHIYPKLSCPESAQNCQDLGSMEKIKFWNPVSLDTFMNIVIMASKPTKPSCVLDPNPTKLQKELLPLDPIIALRLHL